MRRADPQCRVVATDAQGQRWEMTVEANSLYRAVLAYNGRQVCSHERHTHPPLGWDDDVEVTAADGRVFHTTKRKAMAWANREASV